MELPKSKWFWILAPIAAMLFIAFILTFIQNVNATPVSSCGGYQHCTQAEIAAIVNVIAAGNILSHASYTDVAHVGDIGGIEFGLTSPSISGTPAMTWTVHDLNGCTQLGSVTRDTNSAHEQFSFGILVTLTDTTCTGVVRANLFGGLISTEIWDEEIFFTIIALGDLETLGKDCEASTWNSDCAITDFEAFTGMNIVEFMGLILLLIIAIIVWSRSADILIQFSMMLLTFVAGIIWVNLWTVSHATLSLPLSILTFILGGYMGVRAAIDAFEDKRDREE